LLQLKRKLQSQLTLRKTQAFTSTDTTISIANGGDLSVNVDSTSHAPIYVNGSGLTGLILNVDSGSATAGIEASGNNFGAVFIDDLNSIAEINLTSGRITSNRSFGATVQLNSGGDIDLTTAAGTNSYQAWARKFESRFWCENL